MDQNKKKSWFYKAAEWMAFKSGLKTDVEKFLIEAINENQKKYRDYEKYCKDRYRIKSSKDKELIERLQKENSRLATQLDKFESRTHREMSYNMDLQFLEANCDKPLLWVCGDPAMHNSGSFGRIMGKLRELCPRVELVVFTPNGTQIQEMDDEDLFRVGLVRIRTEKLTPEGVKQLREYLYKLPDVKLQIKGELNERR